MSEQVKDLTWSKDELPDNADVCPNCGTEGCDSMIVFDKTQMPCGEWVRNGRYRLVVRSECKRRAELTALRAENARLKGEVERVRILGEAYTDAWRENYKDLYCRLQGLTPEQFEVESKCSCIMHSEAMRAASNKALTPPKETNRDA